MKRIITVTLLILFVSTVTLLAVDQKKEINILAGAGVASSDLKGPVVEIGVEKQLKGNLFGQLYVDYYFNPFDFTGDADSSAFGLTFLGAYKVPVTEGINYVLKLGLHFTFMKEEWNYIGRRTSADLGFAGGGAVEFILNTKTTLYGGVTVKTAVDESRTWLTFNCGLSFHTN